MVFKDVVNSAFLGHKITNDNSSSLQRLRSKDQDYLSKKILNVLDSNISEAKLLNMLSELEISVLDKHKREDGKLNKNLKDIVFILGVELDRLKAEKNVSYERCLLTSTLDSMDGLGSIFIKNIIDNCKNHKEANLILKYIINSDNVLKIVPGLQAIIKKRGKYDIKDIDAIILCVNNELKKLTNDLSYKKTYVQNLHRELTLFKDGIVSRSNKVCDDLYKSESFIRKDNKISEQEFFANVDRNLCKAIEDKTSLQMRLYGYDKMKLEAYTHDPINDVYFINAVFLLIKVK